MSLVSLGYSIGPCGIDGHFGGGTENAVIDFQADHNLNQDGKVGNNTWNEIKAEIKPIQEQLIKLGYSVGSCGADGIYGYSTVEAVKNFQKNNGLSVDGIAGPNTQNALFNSSTSLLTNPAFLGIMGKYMFNEQPKQDNTLDLSKIDLGKLAIFMLQKKSNDEFFDICNKIKSKVFDFLKIEINITTYDFIYTCKTGCLKVTLEAKSGGDFKYEGDKYIFKNNSLYKTEGFFLNTLDFISDKIGLVFVPQIKTNIETFKKKVGESIVNGSVTIKFEFPKLVYEFEVAKKDDLSKLYGKLIISVEFDFDLMKVAEKVGQKVLDSLGMIMKGVIVNRQQIIIIMLIVIGILVAVMSPPSVQGLLLAFA